MPAVRLPTWRRLANALLLGSFLAFIGEIPVADVHDGDASASEVAHADQVAGHSHSESVQQGETESGSSEHNLHVCHCTHSHLSCIPAPEGAGAETPYSLTSVSYSSLDAPSVDPAPALRPPIA